MNKVVSCNSEVHGLKSELTVTGDEQFSGATVMSWYSSFKLMVVYGNDMIF